MLSTVPSKKIIGCIHSFDRQRTAQIATPMCLTFLFLWNKFSVSFNFDLKSYCQSYIWYLWLCWKRKGQYLVRNCDRYSILFFAIFRWILFSDLFIFAFRCNHDKRSFLSNKLYCSIFVSQKRYIILPEYFDHSGWKSEFCRLNFSWISTACFKILI